MDKKLKKNAEGYSDPTAGEAMNNYISESLTMKSGELWEIKQNNGKYQDVLILSVNGSVATCLNLLDMYASNLIDVICQGVRYVDTRKIQFTYQDQAVNFIRALSDDEFDKVMNDVAMKLGIHTKAVEPKAMSIEQQIPFICDSEELIKAKAERDIFKGLYENLLADVMKG